MSFVENVLRMSSVCSFFTFILNSFTYNCDGKAGCIKYYQAQIMRKFLKLRHLYIKNRAFLMNSFPDVISLNY